MFQALIFIALIRLGMVLLSTKSETGMLVLVCLL